MLEYSIFQHFCSIVDAEPAPEKDLKMLTDNCSQLLPKTFNLDQNYEGSNPKTNFEDLTPEQFIASKYVYPQLEENVTEIGLHNEDSMKIRTNCDKNEFKQINNNNPWGTNGDANFRNTVYNEDLLQISRNFSNIDCNSSNCSPQIARKAPTKRNRTNKNIIQHSPMLDYFLNEDNDTFSNNAVLLSNENSKFAANETANDANNFIASACKLSELKAGTNSVNPNSFLNETTSAAQTGYPKAPIANSVDVNLGCRLPESSSAIGASVQLAWSIPHSNILGHTTPPISKTESDLEESDYQDQDAIFYTANDLSQLTPDDDSQLKSDVTRFETDEHNQTRSQETCQFFISHDHLDQSLSSLSQSLISNDAPKQQIQFKQNDSNSPNIPIISSNQTRPLIINYKSANQNQLGLINSESGHNLKPDLPSYNRTPSPSINPALKERLLQEEFNYHMQQATPNFDMTESIKSKLNRENNQYINPGSTTKNYLRPQGGSVRLKPNTSSNEVSKKDGGVGASSLQRSQSARAKPQLRSSASPAGQSRRFLDPDSNSAGHKRQISPRDDPNHLLRQKLPQRSQSARYKGATNHGQHNENTAAATFNASAKGLARQSSEIYYTNDGVVKFRDHRRSVSGRDPQRRYTAYGWDAPNDFASQREAQLMQLTGSDENYERLRNFSIKKGCVVNRGDSFRKRQNEPPRRNLGADVVGRNIPNWSPGKSCIESSLVSPGDSPQSAHRSRQILFNSKSDSGTPICRKFEEKTKVGQPRRRGSTFDTAQFNVSVLGARGTGKSSLITQFMSSEYINPFNADEDANNSDNNSVFILLEEVESKLCFNEELLSDEDTLCSSQEVASPACPSVDGYILIFATNDMSSFQAAKRALESLSSLARGDHASKHRPPIILVANKIDLARKRKISTAACNSLASAYQIKCVEISVDLNHHIDELLVGLLAQLRLHRQKHEANTNSMDGFINTIPRRQLIHSNSSSIDNCDRSELDTDRSDASDHRSITPLLNPGHGRFRRHIDDSPSNMQSQLATDSGKKRRHASCNDGSNNLNQGRQQFQQTHKAEAAKRGHRTSGIVSCASTFVSARNVLLGCLIRKRRPASADSMMM